MPPPNRTSSTASTWAKAQTSTVRQAGRRGSGTVSQQNKDLARNTPRTTIKKKPTRIISSPVRGQAGRRGAAPVSSNNRAAVELQRTNDLNTALAQRAIEQQEQAAIMAQSNIERRDVMRDIYTDRALNEPMTDIERGYNEYDIQTFADANMDNVWTPATPSTLDDPIWAGLEEPAWNIGMGSGSGTGDDKDRLNLMAVRGGGQLANAMKLNTPTYQGINRSNALDNAFKEGKRNLLVNQLGR